MMFFAAAACVQIIKPLGLPGLRRRRDAWKLAVFGLLAVSGLVAIKSMTS